jgi:hypothetical protein
MKNKGQIQILPIIIPFWGALTSSAYRKTITARRSHSYLIFLTDDLSQPKEAEELGMDSVLLKGFNAQKLVEIVEKLIDPRGSTSPNLINKKGGTNAN